MSFQATFKVIKGDSVTLTNASGKDARFPVDELGVADRYYLHETQGIPIEELEGGKIYTVEADMKLDLRKYKKITSIKLKGDGFNVSLDGYLTPYALILYRNGTKIEDYVDAIERAYFSHGYRHPNHRELLSEKRRCYLFLNEDDDEFYDALGKAYIAELREIGEMETVKINQMEVDWSQHRGHSQWLLPEEYAKEYNARPQVAVAFTKNRKSDREIHAAFIFNKRWRNNWAHRRGIQDHVPGGSKQRIKDKDENNIAFSLLTALSLNNDLRTQDEIMLAFGGGLDQPQALITGAYGKTKVWAKELEEKVAAGKIEADFNVFYNPPENFPPTTKEEYRNFGLLLAGGGRFMEHDLKHIFGVCRLCEYMKKNKKLPKKEEFPPMFGYDSIHDMNIAFKEFLLQENRKMKP